MFLQNERERKLKMFNDCNDDIRVEMTFKIENDYFEADNLTLEQIVNLRNKLDKIISQVCGTTHTSITKI